jgi:cytochrome b involved in lipid metabolism
MNHIHLLMGTAIIFLVVALGYTTIPDQLENAQREVSTTTETETASLPAVEESTPKETSEYKTYSYEEKREYDDDEDEHEDEDEDEDEYEDNHYTQGSYTPRTETTAPAPTPTPNPTPEPTTTASGYTLVEVSAHGTESSCWTAVDGSVYDLTPFIKKHPGGKSNIMKICGIDGSSAFKSQHGGDGKPENTLDGYYIGPLI